MNEHVQSFNGFTLIELIITLAVASILLAMAVPSFQETVKSNRMAANVNEFIGALNLARSEAIKRGAPVSVCWSGDGANCGAGGANWTNGWIVFFDSDGDGVVDNANQDTVLRVYPELGNNLTLDGNNTFTNRITYRSKGFAPNGTLVMCDDRGYGDDARAIVIARTGRAQSMKATDASSDACAI